MMDALLLYALLFAIALIATLASMRPVERLAARIGAIDVPGGRHIHSVAVPRLGGVAMMCGISCATAVFCIGVWTGAWDTVFGAHPILDVNYAVAMLGVFLMFMTGLIDDMKAMSPYAKMIGQFVSACVIVSSGLVLDGMHLPWGFVEFGVFAYPITVAYVIAFANVINLIDGLDGLAGGISAIVLATLLWFAVSTARFDAALIAMITIGAIAGFLYFNVHPARVFMGDSGSLTLGTLIAVVSICAISRTPAVLAMAVPIVSAAVPFIDALSAIIRRKRAHVPVTKADAHHIHHQLLNSGLSYDKSVLLMWGWTALMSVGSILVLKLGGWARAIVVIALIAVSVVAIYKLKLTVPATIHARGRMSRMANGVRSRRDKHREKRGGASNMAGENDAEEIDESAQEKNETK